MTKQEALDELIKSRNHLQTLLDKPHKRLRPSEVAMYKATVSYRQAAVDIAITAIQESMK